MTTPADYCPHGTYKLQYSCEHCAKDKRIAQLEAAARQLLSLVQEKGLPHTDPVNQKLFQAGDVILVNEGNLWNLQMVLSLGSSVQNGPKHE